MIRKKPFGHVCAFFFFIFFFTNLWVHSAWCQVWDEEQFRRFFYNYHLRSQPQFIEKALDYFVHYPSTYPEGSLSAEIEQSARARFFAVLAQNEPRVWRDAEKIFPHLTWGQKSILLEVFKRSRDQEAVMHLQAWSQAEQDNDHSLYLEHLAQLSNQPLDILAEPTRDASTLEEQWACFFAAGNTTVVEVSIELLSNTVWGYSSEIENQSLSLMPRERRLRQYAWELFAKRAKDYPAIQQALLGQSYLLQNPDGRRLLEYLGIQALELCNTKWGQQLLPLIRMLGTETIFSFYFQGALAALEQKGHVPINLFQNLNNHDPVWAERLRGYSAYLSQVFQQAEWKEGERFRESQSLPADCGQTLASWESYRMVETWQCQGIPKEELPFIYLWQLVSCIENKQRYFGLEIVPGRQIAWWLDKKQLLRRINGQTFWVEIEDDEMKQRLQSLMSPAALVVLLTQTQPSDIYQINNPEQKALASIHYRTPLNGSLLFRDCMNTLYPEKQYTIIELIVWVDGESRRILRLQAEVEIDLGSNQRLYLHGERLYFDLDSAQLPWSPKTH